MDEPPIELVTLERDIFRVTRQQELHVEDGNLYLARICERHIERLWERWLAVVWRLQ